MTNRPRSRRRDGSTAHRTTLGRARLRVPVPSDRRDRSPLVRHRTAARHLAGLRRSPPTRRLGHPGHPRHRVLARGRPRRRGLPTILEAPRGLALARVEGGRLWVLWATVLLSITLFAEWSTPCRCCPASHLGRHFGIGIFSDRLGADVRSHTPCCSDRRRRRSSCRPDAGDRRSRSKAAATCTRRR